MRNKENRIHSNSTQIDLATIVCFPTDREFEQKREASGTCRILTSSELLDNKNFLKIDVQDCIYIKGEDGSNSRIIMKDGQKFDIGPNGEKILSGEKTEKSDFTKEDNIDSKVETENEMIGRY